MRLLLLTPLACLLAACAPAPPTVAVTAPPPATFSCAPARDADFEGAGEQRLRGFLAHLAAAHGAPAGIDPAQVSLGIVRGAAKLAPAGVQAGEVGCGGGEGPWRVTLYRDALAGRPLALAYETIAHEFHHVVQIHRDRLPCAAGTGAQREAYEREAREVAQRFVPACK